MKPSFLWLSFPKPITVSLQTVQNKLFLTFPSYVDFLVSRNTHTTASLHSGTKSDVLSRSDPLLWQLHVPDSVWSINLPTNRSIKNQIGQLGTHWYTDTSQHRAALKRPSLQPPNTSPNKVFIFIRSQYNPYTGNTGNKPSLHDKRCDSNNPLNKQLSGLISCN